MKGRNIFIGSKKTIIHLISKFMLLFVNYNFRLYSINKKVFYLLTNIIITNQIFFHYILKSL